MATTAISSEKMKMRKNKEDAFLVGPPRFAFVLLVLAAAAVEFDVKGVEDCSAALIGPT